jgi:hypothetical protein
MSEFPIMRVDRSRSQSVEPLGSKPKFWFREGERRILFKAEDRGTGEDWAEMVACHLCALLGLPHVTYELAAEYDGQLYIRPGVICENMARKPIVLVLGNQLLLAADPQYPQSQRFKVRQHTVDAVSDIVTQLAPPAAEWMQSVPAGVQSALDVFTGYVMLDAWIANQDRHHENWGALWDGNVLQLAPTFDHGAALARNLLDEERAERLATKDQNRTLAAFAARGRSAFYGSQADSRPLGLLDAFGRFASKAPQTARAWLERLRNVKRDRMKAILEQIPQHRMSDTAQRFTLELLVANQLRLLK